MKSELKNCQKWLKMTLFWLLETTEMPESDRKFEI